ncbi:hypothetical protein H4Q26_009863 [Puccinia striiformis f. sp. tritici PST-130]|nr:hypothetical protein H4Q26_009863 [Puccinia striiformis f. sp. tritici PST-130]
MQTLSTAKTEVDVYNAYGLPALPFIEEYPPSIYCGKGDDHHEKNDVNHAAARFFAAYISGRVEMEWNGIGGQKAAERSGIARLMAVDSIVDECRRANGAKDSSSGDQQIQPIAIREPRRSTARMPNNTWAHKVSSFQEYIHFDSRDTPAKRPRDDSSIQVQIGGVPSKKLKPNLSTIVSSHSGLAWNWKIRKNRMPLHINSTDSLTRQSIYTIQRLHRTIEPITRSLPLLIHHQEQVEQIIVRETKRNESSDLEKERKRRLIQAREAVNLVATSVLDLFPLKSLSTSSKPWLRTSPHHRYHHLRSMIIRGKFTKTQSIWSLVRNALGAPLPDYQELTKADDRGPNGEDSDSELEEDTNGVEEDLVEDSASPPRTRGTNSRRDENADIDLPDIMKLIPMMRPNNSNLSGFELGRSGRSRKARYSTYTKQKVQGSQGTSVRSLLGEEQGGARVFAEDLLGPRRNIPLITVTFSRLRHSHLYDSQRFGLSANLDNTSHNCRHFEPILDALTTVQQHV